jgi:hypothetical protein
MSEEKDAEPPTGTEPKIFWSWQSDYSPKTCRSFIKICLNEAIKQLASELNVEDADRPSLDHDTKGERGMADITNTILNKIANSAVFVADLTPIATSPKGKWLPNPNVMIELGWAMHRPGWERVIGVLNTASGAEEENLPFDIRQRRIITYILDDKADGKTKKSVKAKLTKELKDAILNNLEDRSEELASAKVIDGVSAKKDNPSIWETAGETLIHNDAFGRSRQQEVGLPDVARSYMRIIPVGWKKLVPSIADISSLGSSSAVNAPSDGAADGDFGATEEGYVRYWITDRPASGIAQASNMTMYFEDTGEFWMLHGNAVVEYNDQLLISDRTMLANWSRTLRRAITVMSQFEARRSMRVEAGLFGAKGARWVFELPGDRPISRRNSAEVSRQADDWSNGAQITFLTNAYNNVRNLFALERLPESQVMDILSRVDAERFTAK